MSDYVTLLGSEQVQNAGRSMQEAAHEMTRAASTIDGALREHRQFMETWLQTLEQILTDNKP